ncbi:MAG: RNase adapter RapZ [Rhodospirillales bacterium]
MTDDNAEPARPARLILVSGVSGAGKSSALKALEDMGYEAVDNLPVPLIPRLVAPGDFPHPVAIGVDIRTRDFDATGFLDELDRLAGRDDIDVSLVFMDCDDEVLVRRFEETRRRHPLADDRPVSDGLSRERRLMASVLERANVIIDTSEMALKDLKQALDGHFGPDGGVLAVFVTSFSYRRGLPRDADLVFDVRFLKNPHYDQKLRPLAGTDRAVGAFIAGDPAYQPFFDNLTRLLEPLLGSYADEGKSYLTIAVGCTGGRHRSVFVADQLARWLGEKGAHARLRHRDLDKSGN